MQERRQAKRLGKELFVGIDVHFKQYSVAIKEGRTEPIRRVTMPADPQGLIGFLKKSYPCMRIWTVYEAGFSGFDLHRKLVGAGINNIVVNASSIPVASNDRVKTDRRDATKLVELLSVGTLKGITVPEQVQESERLITRTREQLVRQRTGVGNQIKSRLMQFGKISYLENRPMSLRYLAEVLGRKDLGVELRLSIEVLSTIYKEVHKQIIHLDKKIKEQLKENNWAKLYQSVPGVGAVSAAILMNELGDMSRFSNERGIYSFTGLTPAEYSSGEHVRRGHISRQGSSRLRHVLVEVAWRAIRQDESLGAVYERLKRTRGGKRAIVGVARRLAGRIRACLREQQPYRLAA